MQKIVWALLAIALVLFLALDQELFSSSSGDETEAVNEIRIAGNCVLSKVTCPIALPDGSMIEVASSLNSIKALEPLDVYVRFIQASSDKKHSPKLNDLSLHFAGREMEMGSHYLIPKSPHEESSVRQTFQGMIPICSVDPKMAWNLVIKFQLNNNIFILSADVNTSVGH